MRPGTGHRAPGSVAARFAGGRVAVTALALLAAGCGYHLVGGGELPSNLRTLHVAPLVNQTQRADLDQRLTDEIAKEWVRRGRFQLVTKADEADAVLSGTVTQLVVTPVRFDEQGRATQYQLGISADVKFVDRTGTKQVVLWRDQRFTRVVSYDVDSSKINYFDRETEAIEQAAREFARGIVVTVLEGF